MWHDQWSGKTIRVVLAEAARRWGDREAMVFENGTLTYRQLEKSSADMARAFVGLGIGRGDVVAIWMAGYAEWPPIYYGLARIGALMVPVNTRYKPHELEYVLNKSKARLLIFKDEKPPKKDYRTVLFELCPEIEDGLQKHRGSRLPYLERVIAISGTPVPGCLSFSDLREAGARAANGSLTEAEQRVGPDDVALLQFTSGTTADPKGAMLYQVAMLRGVCYPSAPLQLTEQDRYFSPQPFFHAGGSIKVMMAPIVTGCAMVVQSYFDPGEALYLMEKHGCNVTMGHQPHYIEYLNHPDLKKRQLKLDRGLIFASPEVNRRVRQELGIEKLISPYGLTETHLGGTSCHIDDPLEKRINTVGRPMSGVEMAIRSTEGEEFLPQGESGEVCFRGWCTMKGYFDDPEKTAAVLGPDGWLRTGDLGYLDGDGYLKLIGRIKDMVRVGGENVAAADVEGFLLRHEKIKQAVVVGMPDPRLGEVCAAFVELKTALESTEDEIVKYCRGGLASFKAPRKVIFVNEWPMTGAGKIQRYVLRDRLWNPAPENR
jgi:acyl-CoA synthetase (AMP-forming)/AMP-acid ligase II